MSIVGSQPCSRIYLTVLNSIFTGLLILRCSMGNKKYEWYSDSARSLFESVKGRMQSLQISLAHLDYGPAARGGQERLVSALLLNCNRDTFTRLVVSSPDCGFITPSNRRSTHSILRLVLTPEQLDNAFASIRVLHLRNLFPEWTSTAYHNLVDLRLMGSCKINESVLVTILKMSPCLRIFHLGIPINRWDHIPTMDSTVELIDLEILRVVGDGMSIPMFQEKVEHLLSLISPGKKALSLFLEYQTRWHLEVLRNPFPVKHTRAFIQRANVVELHAERYPLAIVLASWPITRHVVLHQCIIRNTITLSGDINHNSPFPQSPLEALYLSNCSIPWMVSGQAFSGPWKDFAWGTNHHGTIGRMPNGRVRRQNASLCVQLD
ncbi:hypothetical protein RSOL_262140 [Rhizoctonia solani AG-3 Rhs1AP]|uniref:F-box-like domain protein n=1 Tax=Rhizoctonia solani AG-3 Rhs1AP TaxID=1086054 RepID=A0A0A1UHX8_9AGAM|nr:hypothetical protein RSOL_262140 [Rhizoctonia solani AG-3 Rhs1AP]